MGEKEMFHVVNVKEKGVIGDGKTVETKAIQEIIDSFSEAGGTIYFPAGTYLTGTLYLRDNLTIYLDNDAQLQGSNDLADYRGDYIGAIEAPAFNACLIYAEGKRNITLKGNGTINGNGRGFDTGDLRCERPMLMRLINCYNIRMENITCKDPGSWGTHMILCEKVHIHGVEVSNRVNRNNDAFDLDSCREVFISDCKLSSGDDAICLKGTTSTPCEYIVVTNCVITSNTAAVKFGTSSKAGFRNITISNCVFYDCWMGAIKLQLVDGGIMENINISNIVMNDVASPLFIRLGKRNHDYEQPAEMDHSVGHYENNKACGIVRNITISNIQANVTTPEKTRMPIMMSGVKDQYIENVHLSNITVSLPGGGTAEETDIVVPEDEFRYPEQFFFGVLPASAIYARYINGLYMNNVHVTIREEDAREMFIAENCEKVEVTNSNIGMSL